MKEIGLKIREFRQQKKMSAKDLAIAVGKEGVNPAQYIYDIESGKVKAISIIAVKKLAKALDVDISYFVNELQPSNEGASEPADMLSLGNKDLPIEEKYIRALEKIAKLQQEIIEMYRNSK